MAWRLAKSLEQLRSQVNKASPNRSKASDGTIGDAAHASRSSDHNPHIRDGSMGVVTALDITHDPAHGVDIQTLADQLVASRDPRIKYIICNRRIVSGSGQSQPAWRWRSYGGSNPHSKHVHVSVKGSKTLYDDTSPWDFDLKVSPRQSVKPPAQESPMLKRGSRGVDVQRLQRLLNIQADGVFGAGTEAAVKAFQGKAGIVADGKVGPYTWDALVLTPSDAASTRESPPTHQTPPKAKTPPVKPHGGMGAAIVAFLAMLGAAAAAFFGSGD